MSQDNVPSTFKWLPLPDWTQPVSDEALRLKYNITDDEFAHIEAMVSAWVEARE